MEARSGLPATREHEARELGKLGVEAVALGLEPVDLLLRRAQPSLVLERNREIRAEVEELVLHAKEHLANGRRSPAGEHEPESRVELVDGAVRGDPLVELRHARAVAERGLARVAAARVDLRQPNRLVAVARHGRTLGASRITPAANRPPTRDPREAGARGCERAMTSRWISLVPS